MIIGSHCSLKAPDYFVGSVKEAISYGANALMIYTGPPQNTRRQDVSKLKVDEAHILLKEAGIDLDNVIVHAPYIINLGNSVNESTFELGVNFLKEEIKRVSYMGLKYLVLHPGSYTTATLEAGINQIIKGLNEVIAENQEVVICLETMAGKGSEVGYSFEQLQQIIDGVTYSDKIGICLDTCHIHDAGYDVDDFDAILDEFDKVIGLNKLKVMHINGSKNPKGARKDRHENLGMGYISFESLYDICHNKRVSHVTKILETPYINDLPPYKDEIARLKSK